MKILPFFRTLALILIALIVPAAAFSQPQPPAPANLDFEQGQPGEVPPGWFVPPAAKENGYDAQLVTERPEAGRQAARISSTGEPRSPQAFGNLMTRFDAAAYRGKRIRFRAAVRIEGAGPKDQAALWLRVDRPGGAMGFFDNMQDRPITSKEWKRYEIAGDVAPDAQTIYLGMMTFGRGKAWIDSASFEVAGEAGAGNEPARPLAARGLDNLVAFTRLLGYVRYFHPSDQAAAADWEKLALAGVQAAEKAGSPAELARTLEDLFRPLAPAVRVFPTAGPRPALPAGLEPPAGAAGATGATGAAAPPVVYWEHHGVQVSDRPGVYQSARITTGEPPHGGQVAQEVINISPYRGKRVTLRATARAEVPAGSSAVMRLQSLDRTEAPASVHETAGITASEWRTYEVSADIPKDAMGLEIDLGLTGGGRVWWDDLTLEAAGEAAHDSPLHNAGFETAGYAGPEGWDLEWSARRAGYSAALSAERPRSGRRSLLVAWAKPDPASLPTPGEPLVADLGGGVSALVPLALYKDGQGTLPHAPKPPAPATGKPEGFTPSGDDRATRLADVALAWNVFQHFYPYFDVVRTDWPGELRRALSAAATDADAQAFTRTLQRLVAALHDGHGGVYSPSSPAAAQLPLLWEWVEGQLVVTQGAAQGAGELKPGDVVLKIGGRPAPEALADAEALVSGATPQWRRWNAQRRLAQGKRDEPVQLEARHPDGRTFTVDLTRSALPYGPEALQETRPEKIAEVKPGIFYVDIGRINDDDFRGALDRLAGARGIVFDLRGYPSNLSTVVLAHLTDQPVNSARWNVPVVTRPDRQGWQWDLSSWAVEPEAPRLKAKAAFLTDGRAISYAETYLGIVENYRLAEIVGGPTAGTNGNVNPFTLPGGYRLIWTGMKVLKHDGSQHHGIGIRPTVPAARTVAGIAAGRDEVLEKGIETVSR